NLGNARALKGDLEGAIACFRKAIELEPKLPRVHRNLGYAYARRGQLDQAIAAYRQATRAHPNEPVAYDLLAGALLNRGNALADRGDDRGAEADYREALQHRPGYAQAHCNLGHLLTRKGLFGKALEALRRGHELGSKEPGWRYPSEQWVRSAERLVELDERLPAVLRGKASPAGAAE